ASPGPSAGREATGGRLDGGRSVANEAAACQEPRGLTPARGPGAGAARGAAPPPGARAGSPGASRRAARSLDRPHGEPGDEAIDEEVVHDGDRNARDEAP